MHTGRFIFSELIAHLPHKQFQKCVARYDDGSQWRKFSYLKLPAIGVLYLLYGRGTFVVARSRALANWSSIPEAWWVREGVRNC